MWRSEADTIWVEGYRAAQDTPETATNPYEPLSHEWDEWADGFWAACADMVHGYNHFPTNPEDLSPPNY